MKGEVLVNLAKEAGVNVEDLVFIRQHPEEFEKLKRSVREKPPATAILIEPQSPAASVQPAALVPAGELKPEVPARQPAEAVLGPEAPTTPPPSPAEVAGAINAILGSDSVVPTAMPTELDKPETAAGVERSRSGAIGTKPSTDFASVTSATDHPKTSITRHQDGRHFTYVYVSPDTNSNERRSRGSEGDAAESYHREKIGREGVDFVLKWEIQVGRRPTEMPQTHEGYDVESRNAAGEIERYIEVKAVSSAWSERGVTLSQPQFSAAQRLQEKYWLYVVESADSPSPTLYRIQNPALRVGSFAYDRGWHVLAEPEFTSGGT